LTAGLFQLPHLKIGYFSTKIGKCVIFYRFPAYLDNHHKTNTAILPSSTQANARPDRGRCGSSSSSASAVGTSSPAAIPISKSSCSAIGCDPLSQAYLSLMNAGSKWAEKKGKRGLFSPQLTSIRVFVRCYRNVVCDNSFLPIP
jgi:hypothetical protein